MGTLADSSGAALVREFGGQHCEFPALRKKDLAGLAARWSAEDRAALLRRLGEVNAPAELRFAELNKFDEEAKLISYAYRCMGQHRRAVETLATSLRRDRPGATEAEVEDLPCDWNAVIELALEVAGLDLNELRARARAPEVPAGIPFGAGPSLPTGI